MRRGKKLSEPQITLITLITPITEKIKKYFRVICENPGNPWTCFFCVVRVFRGQDTN